MITLDKHEKLRVFKVAEEQLQTRIHNSKGDNIDRLIDITFDTIDIATLAKRFIKARLLEMQTFKTKAFSLDPLDRIAARELLKKDRTLEQWAASKRIGFKMILEELREEFRALRRGRIV